MAPVALLRAFGEQIRRRRKERGLTQAQLAESVGIAVETVSRIEGGRLASVSLVLAQRVATELGASLAELLAGVPGVPARGLRDRERRIVALLRALDDAEVGTVHRGLRSLLALRDSSSAGRQKKKR